jgi:AraC family transcriptional regulator
MQGEGDHAGPHARSPRPADGFARQFKTATGLPPHQYVIARRVERARRLRQQDPDLSLAEIAVCAGFSDQSQFSRHIQRLVGVSPGQFEVSAKIA